MISLTILLLITACNSNQICVDIENQVLSSTDNVPITKLYIEEEEGKIIRLEKKKGENASNSLSLDTIDMVTYNLYEIGYGEKLLDSFSLKPNSTYRIDNTSIGDAASGEVSIRTGSFGEIIFATRICK